MPEATLRVVADHRQILAYSSHDTNAEAHQVIDAFAPSWDQLQRRRTGHRRRADHPVSVPDGAHGQRNSVASEIRGPPWLA
ncbi:MAG: hypothetical protein DLM62_04045 [Pseudonocardiales bacterium]|nr:MAG: hypothetical protein DLM62_04045 [Pseudonocardiales bacterium]